MADKNVCPHDMTPLHDHFVGAVAILFGCLLIFGALANSNWLMTLAKSQRLAQTFGKTAARWTIAAIGLASVAMGLLIASGWRIRW